MKYLFALLLIATMFSCSENKTNKMITDKKTASVCTDDCEAKNKSAQLSCKLTSKEMQDRKATVLANLKKQMIEKKELANGFAYKFKGSDEMVDELTSFIKTERLCCDFFTFNLSISGDASEAWLELTGPENAKEFIKTELEL